ncbi:PREDICTED: SWR1-complex protein 3-like isoform X4 [Populus euphratica]|uniref:SWR1-complex protein 3-like isoform X3 n=1 Tax=Populus euphratica TaxID=75702 RepID=A0AAJ6WZL1_POPEU|nr:PREDICTED: SWR1-complex protein 3-like isoform X3 [Populus euphratica]XP_010999885.1 PREDICTED: SWR1-complex protein 3-like isoform X4 [Populus euphratica]
MENNIATKKANLPSNYVTLAQLQERWIKEQQRKQKEKEQQEEHDHKKLHNEVAEPGNLSPSVSVSPPSIRSNSYRESHRWRLVGTNVEESKAVSVAVLEENVNEKREEMKTKKRSKGNEREKKKKGEARAQEEGEVTGNLIGTNVEESKAVSVAVLEENVNEKREEMKTKKSWKMKGKKKGEARAQEEEGEVTGNLISKNVEELKALAVAVLEKNVNEKREEMKTKKSWKWKGKGKGKGMKGEVRAKEEEGGLTGSGAQALLVKSEKNNGECERKREMRVEYREKAEKAAEENNQTVEIEKEIGNLSVERKSEKSKTPNKVINGRISNRESKDYNGYANRGHWNYRGYNDGGYRGNGQYRGGDGRFNGENVRYAGGHGSGYGQWKERHNAKVWMKKEEVGDGGDMGRNQSSSVSSKELE